MNKNDLEKAKELFFKYNGSHFQMGREGEYSIYKNYKISKDQEYIWVKEIKEMFLSNFRDSKEIIDLCSRLSALIIEYKDLDGLKEMIQVLNDNKDIEDSFEKIRIVEEVLDVAEIFYGEYIYSLFVSDAALLSRKIMKYVLDNHIFVGEKYQSISYLKDTLKTVNLIERIKRNINLCDEIIRKSLKELRVSLEELVSYLKERNYLVDALLEFSRDKKDCGEYFLKENSFYISGQVGGFFSKSKVFIKTREAEVACADFINREFKLKLK